MTKRKNNHKYNHGRRLRNPYVWAILVPFITIVFIIPSYFRMAEEKKFVYVNEGYLKKMMHYKEEEKRVALLTEKCKEMGAHVENGDCVYSKAEIEARIKKFFPRSHVTMIAIAKAESRLKLDAINYNCYYNDDMTVVYTTRVKGAHGASCKKEHRKYTFGVDCFVLQRHYPNRTTCPEGVILDEHLADVANLSKLQGLNAWSTYNQGKHLEHLTYK